MGMCHNELASERGVARSHGCCSAISLTHACQTPYQAESVNLFQALQHDPAFKGKKPPVLSAARLSKYTPAGAAVREQPRPLKNLTRTLHRLLPVVNTRLRCTKLGGSTSKASGPARILASIEVEMSPASGLPVDQPVIKLEKLHMALERGDAKPILSVALPHTCYSGDVINFVYDMVPDEQEQDSEQDTQNGSTMRHALRLQLDAIVGRSPQEEKHSQTISTSWRTTLNLSPLYKTSQAPKTPLTVTVESETRGPTKAGSTIKWNVLLSNNTSSMSAPRSMRFKVIPLLDNNEQDMISVKPYTTSPIIKAGGSGTVVVELQPLRDGVLTPPTLQLTEIDEKGQDVKGLKATISAEKLPDVVVLPP